MFGTVTANIADIIRHCPRIREPPLRPHPPQPLLLGFPSLQSWGGIGRTTSQRHNGESARAAAANRQQETHGTAECQESVSGHWSSQTVGHAPAVFATSRGATQNTMSALASASGSPPAYAHVAASVRATIHDRHGYQPQLTHQLDYA